MLDLREQRKSRILSCYTSTSQIQKSTTNDLEKSIKDNSVESLEGLVNSKKKEEANNKRNLGLDSFKDSPITAHYINKSASMPEVSTLTPPKSEIEKSIGDISLSEIEAKKAKEDEDKKMKVKKSDDGEDDDEPEDDEMAKSKDKEEKDEEAEITKGFIDWKDANGYINHEDRINEILEMYVVEKSLSENQTEILKKVIL